MFRRLAVPAICFLILQGAFVPHAHAAEFSCYGSSPISVHLDGAPNNWFEMSRDSSGAIKVLRYTAGEWPPQEITCPNSTVWNSDGITVAGGEGDEYLVILLHDNGGFAPGYERESYLSEMEISVHLGDGTDTLLMVGGPAKDTFVMGSQGADVNADYDVDVTWDVANLEEAAFSGKTGEDELSANGGGWPGLPYPGRAVIFGGDGRDRISGGAGNDRLSGGQEIDRIYGRAGDDHLGEEPSPTGRFNFDMAEDSSDILRGGPGDDILRAGQGQDILSGDRGNDLEYGGDDSDLFEEGVTRNGADMLYGGPGFPDEVSYRHRIGSISVTLNGVADDGRLDEGDNVGPESDIEQVTTGTGPDSLVGSSLTDYLYGGRGDDWIRGGAGDDWLGGESGYDNVAGGPDYDRCGGGYGPDSIGDTCELKYTLLRPFHPWVPIQD
jgi:Ca2+-binding RTX toxin-like protein